MRHTKGGSLKSASGFLRLLKTWTLGTELARIIHTCKKRLIPRTTKTSTCLQWGQRSDEARQEKPEWRRWNDGHYMRKGSSQQAWARLRSIGESSSSSDSSSIKTAQMKEKLQELFGRVNEGRKHLTGTLSSISVGTEQRENAVRVFLQVVALLAESISTCWRWNKNVIA